MCIKRILLLASMTIVAMAIAIPAIASAAMFKDAGKEVTNGEFKVVGSVKIVSATNNGFECTVDSRIWVEKAAVVEVKKFEVTASTCVVLGTQFENAK